MRGKLRVRFWAVIQYRITPAHAGKTISASTSAQVCAGSPPRMRGKLFPFGLCYRFVRITPAHAGKTLQIHTTYYHMTGSPPRMRGKPAKYFILPTNSGITPAHAGKTTKPPTKKLTERDHPRACGENLFRYLCRCSLRGSPPRMRGKLDFEFRRQLIDGITPAHAGKTSKER